MITSIITRVNTFRNRFLLINYGTKRPDNFSPERLSPRESVSQSRESTEPLCFLPGEEESGII